MLQPCFIYDLLCSALQVPLPGGQQQTPGWQQGVAVQSIGNSLVPGQMSHTASLPSHFGKGNPPDGTNSTPSNSLSVGGDWAIPSSSRFQYNRMFSNADRFHRGYLTGMEVRPLLLRTGVAQGPLAQIWALVVTDGNSAMKCEDFVIAMHLADCVSKGRQLPATLPPELGKLRKSSTPGISRAGRGGVSVTKSSFAEKCEAFYGHLHLLLMFLGLHGTVLCCFKNVSCYCSCVN